jgi:hypothetical protein
VVVTATGRAGGGTDGTTGAGLAEAAGAAEGAGAVRAVGGGDRALFFRSIAATESKTALPIMLAVPNVLGCSAANRSRFVVETVVVIGVVRAVCL